MKSNQQNLSKSNQQTVFNSNIKLKSKSNPNPYPKLNRSQEIVSNPKSKNNCIQINEISQRANVTRASNKLKQFHEGSIVPATLNKLNQYREGSMCLDQRIKKKKTKKIYRCVTPIINYEKETRR